MWGWLMVGVVGMGMWMVGERGMVERVGVKV